MKISEIGEFKLIERLQRRMPPPRPGLRLSIGDDTAAWQPTAGMVVLATCDSQVEGRHFLRSKAAPYQIGRKSLAVNLSDVAAMGGTPTCALVSLGVPNDLEVEFLDELYRGLLDEAKPFEVSIAGGNFSSADQIFIDVTLFGECDPQTMLTRSGAKPDDVVCVTGNLGAASVGVDVLLAERVVPVRAAARDFVLRAALTPTPRVREGQVIARSGLATAMVDISDGLAADMGHICDESHVSVRLFAEPLPIDDKTVDVSTAMGRDPLDPALHGGEDYELLFTAKRETAEKLCALVQAETGTPVNIIGDILPQGEARTFIRGNGRMIPLHNRGWNHFR